MPVPGVVTPVCVEGQREDPCGCSELNEKEDMRWCQLKLLPAPQKFTHGIAKVGLKAMKRGKENPTFYYCPSQEEGSLRKL